MAVKIRVYATLREALGWSSLDVNIEGETTVGNLLSNIKDLWAQIQERGLDFYTILINGHNIRLIKELDTVVRDNDVIDIFPPAAGG
ncbi:MAG: MoaD family protein [Acidilobaceae archaeon]